MRNVSPCNPTRNAWGAEEKQSLECMETVLASYWLLLQITTNLPNGWWLKTTETYFLTVTEARSLAIPPML